MRNQFYIHLWSLHSKWGISYRLISTMALAAIGEFLSSLLTQSRASGLSIICVIVVAILNYGFTYLGDPDKDSVIEGYTIALIVAAAVGAFSSALYVLRTLEPAQRELEETKSNLARVSKERDELRSKYEYTEEKISVLRKQREEAEDKAHDEKNKRRTAEDERNKIQTESQQIWNNQPMTKDLISKYETVKNKLDDETKDNGDNKLLLSSIKAELSTTEAECGELRQRIEDQKTTEAFMQQQLKNLEQQRRDEVAEKKALQKEMEKERKLKEDAKRDYDRAVEQLQSTEAKHATAMAKLQRSLDQESNCAKNAVQQIHQQAETIKYLEKSLNANAALQSTTETKLGHALENGKSIAAENRKLKERIAEAETEIKRSNDENRKLSEETKSAVKERDDEKKKRKEAEDKSFADNQAYKRVSGERERLERVIDELKRR